MRFYVEIKASHPSVLAGLDSWLQLGLLSESEVKRLCQEHLTCRVTIIPTRQSLPVSQSQVVSRPPPPPSQSPPPPQAVPPTPEKKTEVSWLGQLFGSLMAELSVLWLLLLGVFMVVLSSGVLAASQWERFPAIGQYGILWLYSLGFGAASWWTGKQANLRLTTQALRTVTLLLVPVNFLAMDSFNLWRSPVDGVMLIVATLCLTGMTVALFRTASATRRFSLPLLNHLGLSYLQWGWAIPGIPLLAAYVGVIGTTVITLFRPPDQKDVHTSRLPFSLNSAIAVYSLAILLVRAIFLAKVEIFQLGLAVGMCGWLFLWRFQSISAILPRIGLILLILGWLLSVDREPGQAIAVSALALLWLARRLLHHWLRRDFTFILLIGLQIHWLGWRLLPEVAQKAVIDWTTAITASQDTPWALLSLGLFPYLILIVALSDWFSRINKNHLATFGGCIALFLGSLLTSLSLINPLLRTLNLAASTVVLGKQRQKAEGRGQKGKLIKELAILTHLGGLLTVISAIAYFFPHLNLGIWATILLGLMVLEAIFDLRQKAEGRGQKEIISRDLNQPQEVRQNGQDDNKNLFPPSRFSPFPSALLIGAWDFCLILGGFSYILLLFNQQTMSNSPVWGCLWLVAPLVTTSVATWNLPRRQQASWLSVVGLGLLQLLTLSQPETRLFGLITATGLMVINSNYLRHQVVAILAVGFGLATVAAGLDFWQLSESQWWLAGAIATLVLWLFRHALTRYPSALASVYSLALDGWAFTISMVVMFAKVSYTLTNRPLSTSLLISLLLMGSSAYRSWQPASSPSILWFSVAVLNMLSLLTIGLPDFRWLILLIATGLMFVQTRLIASVPNYSSLPLNVDQSREEALPKVQGLRPYDHQFYLPSSLAAILTVGLGLGLIGVCLWDGLLGVSLRGELNWLGVGAIAIIILWGLRHWLIRSNTELTVVSEMIATNESPHPRVPVSPHQSNYISLLYAQGTDFWAISLFLVILCQIAYLQKEIRLLEATFLLVYLMATSTYRSWQPPRSPLAIWLSIATIFLMQLLPPHTVASHSIALGIGTVLMLLHTHYLKELLATLMTVGLGLAFIVSCLWLTIGSWEIASIDLWLLAAMVVLIALWGLRSWLINRSSQLAQLYTNSIDSWGILLCSLLLAALTTHSLGVYWDAIEPSRNTILAAGLLMGAIAYRSWQHPTNLSIYGIGWALELLTIEVLGLTGRSWLALAIANTILGILTQIIGDWWYRRSGSRSLLSSFHLLPLFYGALGTVLRWNVFNSWTGFSSLGLVVIALGVGRRNEAFKPLIYLGIAGISLSAYELLFYQIANLPMGDRLLAMAALATGILYAYRLLCPWLLIYLRLQRKELDLIAHLHWFLGTLFLGVAVFYPVSFHQLTGLGAGVFLTRYAIMQGRNSSEQIQGEIWVYLGLLEAIAIAAYVNHIIPYPPFIADLLARERIGIAPLSLILYALPWQRWGWSSRPWRVFALLIPLIGVSTAVSPFKPSIWLVAAICYGLLAQIGQQRRLFYLSLILLDGAIAYQLGRLTVFQNVIPFAYWCLLGLSILAIIWIEPICRLPENKPLRHSLRLLGTGVICGCALLFHNQTGILPGSLGIVMIFVGLGLQVRAFLYVGTITFLINAFYQLVILSFSYPLLKWIVGLLIGLMFIWIAASFENRRTQLFAFIRHWTTEFEEWE